MPATQKQMAPTMRCLVIEDNLFDQKMIKRAILSARALMPISILRERWLLRGMRLQQVIFQSSSATTTCLMATALISRRTLPENKSIATLPS